LLGLVELRGGTEKDVFVVGGGGTGIRLFRALARKGYGITAGVLHQNDQDFAVARIICREVIGEEPFEPIREPAAAKARTRMRESRCIVDSGFAVGAGNRENMRLLCEAAAAGQPVFSLRTEAECRRCYGERAARVQSVGSISALLERIAALR
jgi:iron complex transport system ATP-binding protein